MLLLAGGNPPSLHLSEDAEAPATCAGQEVAAIIQTCLRFKPEQRPSAKEVLALVAALEGPPQGGPNLTQNGSAHVMLLMRLASHKIPCGAITYAAASMSCSSACGGQHGSSSRVQGLYRELGTPSPLRQRPPAQLRRPRLN